MKLNLWDRPLSVVSGMILPSWLLDVIKEARYAVREKADIKAWLLKTVSPWNNDISRTNDKKINSLKSDNMYSYSSLSKYQYGFSILKIYILLDCLLPIDITFGTSVVLLRCPLVPEIMHGGATEVRVKLKICHITLQCWCETQQNKRPIHIIRKYYV